MKALNDCQLLNISHRAIEPNNIALIKLRDSKTGFINTKVKLINFDFSVTNLPDSGITCKPVEYASALYSS